MASWGRGHQHQGGGQEGQAGVHDDYDGVDGGLWYLSSVGRLDGDFTACFSFIAGCVTVWLCYGTGL